LSKTAKGLLSFKEDKLLSWIRGESKLVKNKELFKSVSYKEKQVGEIVTHYILHTVYWLSNVFEYFRQYFPAVLLNLISTKDFLN